jgi:4-hydroxy-3-methylbut-2-enyl diphosphate reductase
MSKYASACANQGYEIVMIGHKGHPEVEGTMGQADGGMYLVENVDRRLAARVPGNVPATWPMSRRPRSR